MMMNIKTILTITLLAFLLPLTASAIQPDHARQMAMAKRYIAAGEIEEAYQIIDNLLELYPSDQSFLNEVYKIYKDNKDYEKALGLLDHLRMLNTGDKSLTLEKGNLYLRMANTDSAAIVFEKYLKRMGYNSIGYNNVSRAYQLNGYYTQATENYLSGRQHSGDSTLFAQELGWLYRQRRNYKQAAIELYNYMVSDTSHQRHGESSLQSLINYVDDYSDVIEAFRQIIASHPNDYRAYDYYADLQMRNGELDSAFNAVVIADSLDRKDGRHLLSFANGCLVQKHYEMAAKTSRYILDNYEAPQNKGMAEIYLAQSYINLDLPDSAVLIYHAIVSNFPVGHARWFDGIYLLGKTFLEDLYQTDSARYYFNELIQKDNTQRWRDRAKLKIADSYIVDGDLKRADSIYMAVQTNRLEKQEKEELLFKRAQIKFFNQDYDQAKGLYQHLSGIYPRSLYVNDCLRKILIIDENTGVGLIDLNLYSDAERMIWQNRIDSALTRLVDLSSRGASALSALATFEAGKIYYQKEDYQKSFEMFTRVLESFGGSFYSAESQRYIGDLYFYHFNDKEKAAEAYRLILENYPNRVLYEYARRQLRKLES